MLFIRQFTLFLFDEMILKLTDYLLLKNTILKWLIINRYFVYTN